MLLAVAAVAFGVGLAPAAASDQTTTVADSQVTDQQVNTGSLFGDDDPDFVVETDTVEAESGEQTTVEVTIKPTEDSGPFDFYLPDNNRIDWFELVVEYDAEKLDFEGASSEIGSIEVTDETPGSDTGTLVIENGYEFGDFLLDPSSAPATLAELEFTVTGQSGTAEVEPTEDSKIGHGPDFLKHLPAFQHDVEYNAGGVEITGGDGGGGDEPEPRLSFTATNTGGFIAFGEDSESAAREEGISFPEGSLTVEGQIFEDGSWESTNIESEPLTVLGILEAEVEAPNGLSGELEIGSNRLTTEGELEVSVLGSSFSFEIAATTEQSGALDGEGDIGLDGGNATLVDNEFTVDEPSGNLLVDIVLGLPITESGQSWLELPLEIQPDSEEPEPPEENGTLDVSVVDGSGNAIEGASVSVAGQSAQTDANGAASFDLAEGSYTVSADANGLSASTSASVTAGETSSVTLELTEDVEPSFTASNTGGFISFGEDSESAAREAGLNFDPDGILIEGDIDVEENTWESTNVNFEPLSVAGGLQAEVTAPNGLSGELDVQNDFLTAQGRLEVSVTGNNFGFEIAPTTGQSGALEGSADLSANGGTATLVDNEFVVSETSGDGLVDSALGLPITEPGRSWLELPLDVDATGLGDGPQPPEENGTLDVSVVDQNGDAVEGASVSADGQSAQTDANGDASFDLEEGSYTVTAEADGESATTSADVTAGETTNVELTLAVAATGELTFTDQVLENGTVTVEDVSTGQPSTVVVTYSDGDQEVVAGVAAADNLDSQDVAVTIEDTGGFPGAHTAWVFADEDLPADLSIGDDATPVADAALDSETANVTESDDGDDGDSGDLPDSFNATVNGGFAGFNYSDEATARQDGLQFPAGVGYIVGEVSDDGSWQSTDVSFQPLSVGPLEGQLSTPNGFSGTLDVQNNFLNASGTLKIDVSTTSFSFDVTLTSEESGAMEGSASLSQDGGTATLVANDFGVPESGSGVVDSVLGLPIEEPADGESGRAFVELQLDIDASSGDDGGEQPAQNGTLDVSVVDQNGDAVEDASVSVDGQSAQTDANGDVSFDLEEGSYTVTADADGESASQSVSVTANETTSVELTLPVAPEGSLTFTDQQLQNGEVTVEDVSTSQPSTVVVTYSDGDQEVVAGTAAADDLDGKDVSVAIEDTGGFPGEHTAWVFADEDLPADLSIGDDATPVEDAALASETATVSESTGTLAVSVVDQNDDPIGDASVSVDGQTATTDANGEASFELSPGTYDVSAEAAGSSATTQATVEAGSTKSQTVELELTGTLALTVEDQDDQPIEGATVDVDGQSESTDSNGEASFELAPGSYDVTVTGEDDQVTQSVDVTAGTVTEQTLQLQVIKTGTLEVTVTDANNNPLEGAAVFVGSEAGQTDSSGEVSFELEEGSYTVTAEAEGESASQSATVQADATTTANIQLPITNLPDNFEATNTGGFIAFDESSESDARSNGVDFPSDGVTIEGDVSDDGTWESTRVTFPVLETDGSIEVNANAPNGLSGEIDVANDMITAEGTLMVTALVEGQPSFSFDISATTGESGALTGSADLDENGGTATLVDNEFLVNDSTGSFAVDARLGLPLTEPGLAWLEIPLDTEFDVNKTTEDGTLAVTVEDQDGQPVEGATVDVAGQSAQTDASGEASFELAPGSYTVTAEADGSQSSTVVSVQENATTETTLQVDIDKTGTLAVDVLDQDDEPVEDATVELDTGDSAQTDANGEASFELPEGPYTVTAQSGDSSSSTDAQVTAGETTDVSLSVEVAKLPDSFNATVNGGFAGFDYDDEATARQDGLQFPEGVGYIVGDVNDDGTWQSTDVSFQPLAVGPLEGQLSTPNGFSGTLDIENNFLNASGTLKIDVSTTSFSFDVTLTSEESGAMEGSASLSQDGGTATIVANDFGVPESGSPVVNDVLGLPIEEPADGESGRAFIELQLDITTSNDN